MLKYIEEPPNSLLDEKPPGLAVKTYKKEVSFEFDLSSVKRDIKHK